MHRFPFSGSPRHRPIYLALLFLLAGFMLMQTKSEAGEAPLRLAQADPARALTDITLLGNEWLPYLRFENGEPKGMAFDKVAAAFRHIGRRLLVQEAPFIRALAALEHGERAGLLLASAASRPYTTLSKPIFCDARSLYFRQGSERDWSRHELPRGTRLGKLRGPNYGPAIARWEKEGLVQPVEAADGRALFEMLKRSRVDVVVFSEREAEAMFAENPALGSGIVKAGQPVLRFSIRVAFSTHHPDGASLQPAFDQALDDLGLEESCPD